MKIILGVLAVVLLILLTPWRSQAAAPQGYTVSGTNILRDGQPWVPYGFSEYTFGKPEQAAASVQEA